MQNDQFNSCEITRRHFIRTGAAGLAAVGMNPLAIGESSNVYKLPKRRYGRTGLQLSSIVGAANMNPALVPMAVKSGVNYWHRANDWTMETLPAAIKAQPRESQYLEIVVPRVRGDHRNGVIDEEEHYQYVKDSLKKTGFGYYDAFKHYFGYHSLEEAKTNAGMIRAFERLKKEGLVKHLVISQHHYNDIGGDMAYEILQYVIEKTPYEGGMFFFSYGAPKEMEEMVALAKKHDFGTMGMKTMRGVGRAIQDDNMKAILRDPRYIGSRPGAATVKWLMSNPNLDTAIIAAKTFDEMSENYSAAVAPELGNHDRRVLEQLAAYNEGLTCTLCSECVSRCPENIAIADIFRYERYALDYHALQHARRRYNSLTKNGTSCIACGDCLPVCGSRINIVDKLRDVHNLLA